MKTKAKRYGGGDHKTIRRMRENASWPYVLKKKKGVSFPNKRKKSTYKFGGGNKKIKRRKNVNQQCILTVNS